MPSGYEKLYVYKERPFIPDEEHVPLLVTVR
jgi:hypothetical protein